MSKSQSRFITLLIILLMTIAFPTVAGANGMPVVWSEDNFHGPIVPVNNTVISIESEQLEITFLRESRQADVTVTYTLVNPTQEVQSVKVLFLGDIIGEGVISLNNKPVRAIAEAINMDSVYPSISRGANFIWYNPYTATNYPKPETYGGYEQRISGVPFELELAPGTHSLHVQFKNPLGYDQTLYLNSIYHLTYLLQPASYWQSFKDLQILVTLPKGNYRLASSLPLETTDGRTWSARFLALPAEDLHVSIINTSGMWFGRYSSRRNLWLMLVVFVGLPYFYQKKLLPKLPGQAGMVIFAGLTILAGWYAWGTLTRTMLQYPLTVLQYPLLAMIELWLIYRLIKVIRNDHGASIIRNH